MPPGVRFAPSGSGWASGGRRPRAGSGRAPPARPRRCRPAGTRVFNPVQAAEEAGGGGRDRVGGTRGGPPLSPPGGRARRSAVPAASRAHKMAAGPGEASGTREESPENGRRSDDVIRWRGRQERPGTGRVHACRPPSGPCSLRGGPHWLLGPNIPEQPLQGSPQSPPDTPSPAQSHQLAQPRPSG